MSEPTIPPPDELSILPSSSEEEEQFFEDDDFEDFGESELTDGTQLEGDELQGSPDTSHLPARQKKKRRRSVRSDAEEFRLLGRHALCKKCVEIASSMQKIVKNRLLKDNPYKKSLDDDELTNLLRKEVEEARFGTLEQVRQALVTPDDNFDRGQLKAIILSILLQEETYSCEERQLNAKLIEFERDLVKRAVALDWDELKKRDPDRWHQLDTYRIVLDAAWSQSGVSQDEARLLAVLRQHLTISLDEHWLISAVLNRFPKQNRAEHNPDEIDEARKQLQRDGLLWSYCDDNGQKIDPVPADIAVFLRDLFAGQELQRVNFKRLLQHDGIMLSHLKGILQLHGLDKSGIKAELIDRIVVSSIKPSEILNSLEKGRLSSICAYFGLKAYGNKPDLVQSLINFYDDLTFEVGTPPKDEREVWYNNYELIACRSHAELRAKKLIAKDIEIERMFESATEFLFSKQFRVPCERANAENRADGRLPLENQQSILWDCKSVESAVNLQDHLEGQFDLYLRKEQANGKTPLAFLVIGPAFTEQSLKLAYQYKSRTNWDIALITAEGLKHLADRWVLLEPDKPFPVRLLNRTEIIDKARAEFLLSLA